MTGKTTVQELAADAAAMIGAGEVVCFPTESFYGLAIDIESEDAISRMKTIKAREGKPVALIASDIAQARMAVNFTGAALRVAEHFWPGPLTLVAPATDLVPSICKNEEGLVGIRVSTHSVANAIASLVGKPITATSANLSGRPPCVTVAQVKQQLDDAVRYVDGGVLQGGAPSTVAMIDNDRLIVLREGAITAKQLGDFHG